MKNVVRAVFIGTAMTFLGLVTVTPAAAEPILSPVVGVDIKLTWCGKCWGSK